MASALARFARMTTRGALCAAIWPPRAWRPEKPWGRGRARRHAPAAFPSPKKNTAANRRRARCFQCSCAGSLFIRFHECLQALSKTGRACSAPGPWGVVPAWGPGTACAGDHAGDSRAGTMRRSDRTLPGARGRLLPDLGIACQRFWNGDKIVRTFNGLNWDKPGTNCVCCTAKSC